MSKNLVSDDDDATVDFLGRGGEAIAIRSAVHMVDCSIESVVVLNVTLTMDAIIDDQDQLCEL